jgi:hypothetical protein
MPFLKCKACPPDPVTSEAGARRPRSISNLWTLVSNWKNVDFSVLYLVIVLVVIKHAQWFDYILKGRTLVFQA